MLLACGDALIDFVPVKSADGRDAYVPAVGGSCLNIAVAMSRLGVLTGFVGGVSNDMFGAMIADHLTASGVSLRYVRHSDDETTLAFVRFVNNEPHYAFYDETTAARLWTYRPDSMCPSRPSRHCTSAPPRLINEPVASEYLSPVQVGERQDNAVVRPQLPPEPDPRQGRLHSAHGRVRQDRRHRPHVRHGLRLPVRGQ